MAGSFSRHDLQGLRSPFEVFVEPFNDVGRAQADPLLLSELQICQAGLKGVLKALGC